ncbi:MAG: PQQ-binding-like beta-propeller repeat protein, partial [Planctomycetales bacterium]|nr:PQQ-binding-like beta-propeller repeat protein [Planctomycetales bacterium]
FSRETIARPIVGDGTVYASASMIGGVADDQPDPEPFWKAMLHFDANGDERLGRSEITEHFTIPFRPDLPVGHPGFGIPLPSDPDRRKERQESMFDWTDKNKDGFWTHDEFVKSMSFNRGKPNLIAVRPGGTGNVSDSHVPWALHKNIPEIPSPVFYDGRIYLVRDGGILTAIDAATGKVIYRKRLQASGHYRASPVIANDHIYLISEVGMLTVVKAGDEFDVISQTNFEDHVAATPAIDKDTIYIRTEKRLYAFRQ